MNEGKSNWAGWFVFYLVIILTWVGVFHIASYIRLHTAEIQALRHEQKELSDRIRGNALMADQAYIAAEKCRGMKGKVGP